MTTHPRSAVPLRARAWGALGAAVVATLLAGCADPWDTPRTGPSASGSLGAGFVPDQTPSPAATVVPAPGSWDGIVPTSGYRVVLLTYGDDEPTRNLVAAVAAWADTHGADLRTVRADGPDDLVAAVVRALDLHPDLVVSAGDALVDPLALVTPSHLDQQFLVLGAELAEPTHNVTAVDWTGAGFRGEGLSVPSAYDPASFTPDRCAEAVQVGAAAVLGGQGGYVYWIR
ncbi:MAG: hypothetical protein FWH11_01600 [Micrococcales bacterium]|nr:hypothetical protein [Micrococcales bacterium]